MRKIIITIRDNFVFDDVVAMERISEVIRAGKVSSSYINGKKCAHYCWMTQWKDGIYVGTRMKSSIMGADSFIVDYKKKINKTIY